MNQWWKWVLCQPLRETRADYHTSHTIWGTSAFCLVSGKK